MIDEIRKKIVSFADQDELGWVQVAEFRFPKRALLWYALGRSAVLREMLPAYEAFSPMGLKLGMDDPYHSDVWIGAGLDPDFAYNHRSDASLALTEAVVLAEEEWQEKMKFDFTVLADGRDRKIPVVLMVYEYVPLGKDTWSNIHIDCADPPKSDYDNRRAIVIPHAGVEFDLAARNADVIITEVGGPLAHLSIVSREQGKVLIRVKDAVKRFPRWSKLYLDIDRLKLEAVGT